MSARFLFPLILFPLLAATTALAAGTVTIEGQGDEASYRMVIEYLDNNTLRMDFPGDKQAGGYMLVRDGKVYTVTRINGVPMVMDMGAMGKMAAALGGGDGKDHSEAAGPLDYQILEIKDTGRNETVAGFKGRVYRVTVRDSRRGTQTEEIVFSDDPRVRAYTDAWSNAGKTMERVMGAGKTSANDLNKYMQQHKLGLLRFGREFRVVGIDDRQPAADRFKLPSSPMGMPDLGSMLGGALQAQ
jgi:hypothetical protein